MPAKKPKETKRSSDEAVKAKTGKVWAEWFKILDKAGAKKMPHKEIALYLYEKQKLPAWWCQMVAVGYEQERGLRQKIPEMRWRIQRFEKPHHGGAAREGLRG